MSWLSVLRAILNFLYFFAWISAVAAPMIFFSAVSGVDIYVSGLDVNLIENPFFYYSILAASVAGHFFYLAMIHHLRKSVYKINRRQLLSFDLKSHLFKAGLYCVIGGLLTKVCGAVFRYFIYPLMNEDYSRIKTPLNINDSFDSIFLILAFGIFLIIFSKIIERSLMLQEENALTV